MRRDEHALSPVLGTMLLVAIVVLLTGAVFLVAKLLAEDKAVQPGTAWEVEPSTSSAKVVTTDQGVRWSHYVLRYSGEATGSVTLLGEAYPIEEGRYTRLGDAPVAAGQVLSFCVDGGEPVTVIVRHIDSNSRSATFAFPRPAGC